MMWRCECGGEDSGDDCCCVSVGDGGVGSSECCGGVLAECCVKMSASWCNCLRWLVVSGQIGDAGVGLLSDEARSRAAAIAAWEEERNGMVTCCGNHASVSATRSAFVTHTQTR
jgi:hypothetical protein